jgi:hypothetical protein
MSILHQNGNRVSSSTTIKKLNKISEVLLMKHFFFVSLLALLSTAFANSKTAFQYDNNKDGIVDSTYYYDKNGFYQFKRDINYDGRIDHTKSFKISTSTYIEKQDLNFDGSFEVKKVAKVKSDEVKYSLYKLKNNSYRLVDTYSLPTLQTKSHNTEDDCNYVTRNNTISDINEFVSKFDASLSKANNDFHIVENYEVHKSCVKQFGKKGFKRILQDANQKGYSCLSKLAKESVNSKNQIELFNLLNKMDSALKSNTWNVKIICNDKESFKKDQNSRKSDALAQATYTDTTYKGYKHPLISISPHLKTGFFGNISKDEMTTVLFHEMLHNYGYTHGDGMDLAYGCEVCCFPGEFSKKAQKSACNVCKGDYKKGILSKDYMKDIAQLGYYSKLNTAKTYFADNFRKFGNDSKYRAAFLTSLLNSHPNLLKHLNKKHPDITESYDKDLYKKIKNQEYHSHNNDYLDEQAKIASQLVSSIFFSRDKNKIISALDGLSPRNILQVYDRHSSHRVYPGGFKLLSDIEVIIRMALRKEKDPQLRGIYASRLIQIDHAFKNRNSSNSKMLSSF